MKNIRKHIKINNNGEKLRFSPITGGGSGSRIPERNRITHAYRLEKEFTQVWNKHQQKENSIMKNDGVYLQFIGKRDFDLIYSSLENVRQNVRLCNVMEKDSIQYATVFLPLTKKDFVLKRLESYREEGKSKDLLNSIEKIKDVFVEEMWTDDSKIPLNNKEACEVWLSVYKKENAEDVARKFFSLCEELGIEHYNNYIEFPERCVVSILADYNILEKITMNFPHVAEFRRNETPTDFFIKDNNIHEQKEWVNELLSRIEFNNTNFSICLLDTGISNGHPLILPVLEDKDMHTTFDDNIVQDRSRQGHGTGMAGIATYFNLEKLLESNNDVLIDHHLESVRIVDHSIKNKVSLYADVTSEAISKVEIQNPNNKRVIAMAVTSGFNLNADRNNKDEFRGDGKPTSWSAGIDNLALGNYGAEDSESRLIILAAGNTNPNEISEADDYRVAVSNHSVENPAQSWNALTVGAFTEKTSLSTNLLFAEYRPLVERGGYSPLTSSSLMWSSKWPIKPEVVFEGGNVGFSKDAKDFRYDVCDNFSLLTTNNIFHNSDYFTTINATSSATAQASYLAINIMKQYPNIWPQTVRAIMVHSAKWTDEMYKQVYGHNDKKRIKKTDYIKLLRIVGYGKPDIDDALYSFKNSVNMIVEDELQPFKKEKSRIVINEMVIHEIPWPKEVLLDLGDTPVKMKVTLSYFIDPSPGKIGWEDKYRYPGCRLSFDVNNVNEDKDSFINRINKIARENAIKNDTYQESKNISERWLIGSYNRNVGSIHSDVWEDTASNLAENRFIAVYPGGGWWKSRSYLNKYNNKVKYSLIVSIQTPDELIDLYTPVQNKVSLMNSNIMKTEIKY